MIKSWGVGRSGVAPEKYGVRRFSCDARVRNGTKYGRSRTSVRSFYVHHTQQLAAAAQVGDAKAMRRKIAFEKMSLMKRARRAGGSA